MIVLKPYAGLANRIRVIASAVALAKKLDFQLEVIWDANEELNCPFYDLFKPNKFFNVKETNTSILNRKVEKGITKVYNTLGMNYPRGFDLVLLEKDISLIKSQNYDFLKLKSFNDVYINTCHVFYGHYSDNELDDFFFPIDPINSQVKDCQRIISNKTVGVHIRQTDHEVAILKSPLSLFITILKEEIKKDENTDFFVCTDDINTENKLKSIFGEKIKTKEKELSRNTKEGIQDALIDLICLSKTKYILGSYYSSFSEMAAYIGGVDLKIVAKNTLDNII